MRHRTTPLTLSLADPRRPSAAAPARLTQIVVIVTHPQIQHSRVNAELLRAARAVESARVMVRDLYTLYPDYYIDVDAEQAAIAGARLIVWQPPVHWYNMPPLMKLWLDEVFAFGWAYGPGGNTMRGKDLWPVLSTDGAESSYRPDGYNRYFFDAFLPPYEQTAALTGMRLLPLVLHAAHRVADADVAAHAAVYAQRLRSYPDWPEIASIEPEIACDVPADARPADDMPLPASAMD